MRAPAAPRHCLSGISHYALARSFMLLCQRRHNLPQFWLPKPKNNTIRFCSMKRTTPRSRKGADPLARPLNAEKSRGYADLRGEVEAAVVQLKQSRINNGSCKSLYVS